MSLAFEAQKPTAIVSDIAQTFTFASHQNSVPIIRSIRIENTSTVALEDASLEMVASPAFLRPKTWRIERILPSETLDLHDRGVMLDAGYLAGLNEAERGDISFRLMRDGNTLAEHSVSVRLLARDEWGGVADMAQLLPAFIMPNDPAVARLLRDAGDRLGRYGHSTALDGYQTSDPRRPYMIAAATYSSVAALGAHYAQPPTSFEVRGQKIRIPTRIVDDRLATCLDTTNLIAAALEAAGLNPVVLLFEGHAAVGVWLLKKTLPNLVESDVTELRKAIAHKELIVFETTGVCHRPPMLFREANSLCEKRLTDDSAMKFVCAIDVARSRNNGIAPLASHVSAPEPVDSILPDPDLPLPSLPDFDTLPIDQTDVKPSTAAGRIGRWQSKLLDLTRNNRLINFKDSKKAVSFLCSDIAYLEDRLADGAAVKLIALPEQNPLGERDAALYRDMRGHDIHQKFAKDALQRDELASPLVAKDLDARLTALYRQAKSDMAEGGTNTLFLAVGILRWVDQEKSKIIRKSPLLLLPVKLERSSAASRFRLRFHEDEPRFNQTLVQFVKGQFDLDLPDFRDGLPSEGRDVDVKRVLDRVRQAVREAPGFEVVEETALSTFSFSKYLMWKDLTDRIDALRQNRVVKHLIDNPDRVLPGADAPFPSERDVDRIAPADLILPLSADSSQIAACVAAAQGRDFTVIGPPGTGKSQTIANLIAMLLGNGQRVLFVAEKTAALDVVYRRLDEKNLADHCLELHSNKADRRHFLSQLKKSWEAGSAANQGDWVAINDRLRIRRDQLNLYVEALHTPQTNGWSAFRAISIAAPQMDQHAPALAFCAFNVHDRDTFQSLENLAGQLGLTFGAVKIKPALRLVHVEEWTSVWQEQLLSAARTLGKAAADARASLERWSTQIGLPSFKDSRRDGLKYFADLARNLTSTSGKNFDVILSKNFSQFANLLGQLEGAIASYREMEAKLSAPYSRSELARIPIDDLDREWRAGSASIWPMSWLAKRKIRRLLSSYAGSASVDPGIDISLIRRMQEAAQAVSDSGLRETSLPVVGLDTDTTSIKRHLELAKAYRAAIVQLGEFAGDMKGVATSIAAGLTGEVNLPQVAAAEEFLQKYRVLVIAIEAFETTAGAPLPPSNGETFLATLSSLMEELGQARNSLRDWSSWCAVREKAIAQGLKPLVDDIEAGAIPANKALDAFRLGYARWWLPLLTDNNRVLRSFRRFEHEHAIADFRTLDDLVAKTASARIKEVLMHGLPEASLVPRNSELGRLRHQMGLQRPSTSIRDMIGAMPVTFGKLAPCVLMSPLSIAQYLPPNQELFDVVVFDEASQISTWDAVGAIARGKQTIIVGDPKQLPPTNFFGRSDDDPEDIGEYERDLESILDEACASGLPQRNLRWHYRSRHESLIAFSNYHYYDNSLITFPSPVTHQAVTLSYVKDGVYDRGKSRTNRTEAVAIAKHIRGRLKKWIGEAEETRQTLGVITFNVQQQALIQDLLDDMRREEPELEWFFSDDRIEPVIVKNLENIQGDERDEILFSICFGRDTTDRLTMDFGALNRDGGERRLNVAVTRARRALRVFSSVRAEDIDLSRTAKRGTAHLKAFLDYADRGPIALPAQDRGSVGSVESSFEAAVAAGLERRGWQVATQIGVSAFRIDLGIKHPDFAGAFLAGVECDGATYHGSATARDRDKVRELILTGLGWTIFRVWSPDWWFNADEALDKLHSELIEALASDRKAREQISQSAADVGDSDDHDHEK